MLGRAGLHMVVACHGGGIVIHNYCSRAVWIGGRGGLFRIDGRFHDKIVVFRLGDAMSS